MNILLGPAPETLAARSALMPGAPALADYWAVAGEALAADSRAKASPELTALAFWLRRGRLEKLAKEAQGLRQDHLLRLARGTVFHVAPANVEALFAYSLCLAHLCGNRSIVRLPSKRGEVAAAILDALAKAEAQVSAVAGMNALVIYPRSGAETAALSALCDARVVWGGDATVREIGAVPLPPRALEIRFADRFSLAVLDAATLPEGEPLARFCDALLADITAFDQLACSCPRALVWVGGETQVARVRPRLLQAMGEAVVRRRLRLDPSRAVDRRVAACRMAAEGAVRVEDFAAGRLTCVEVPSPDRVPALAALHPGGGLLLEGRAATPEDAARWLPDNGQTVVAHGFAPAEVRAFAAAAQGRASRVVAPGRALDFGPVWDGRDLFSELTRTVAVDFPRTGESSHA